MTKELETYLRSVIEEIRKRPPHGHGHASWIHLNRGQHPELKGYPVYRVRYRIAGQVREEQIIQSEVEVIDYSMRKDE